METIADIRDEIFPVHKPEGVTKSAGAVMIIDDNLEIIAALKNLLADHYDVIACVNYEEAQRSLTPEVRVVLLDIKMAGKDGIEVFALLQEQRPDLRIIFHSAYAGSSEKAVAAEQLHHSGYLTKGDYRLTDLLDLIRRAINGV